jgi:hypothetical protein
MLANLDTIFMIWNPIEGWTTNAIPWDNAPCCKNRDADR